MQLLNELKEQGYKVRTYHNRPATGTPKGGITVVSIFDAEEKLVTTGVSFCSRKDNFNKKLGRTIALGRAYCQLTGEAARRKERHA